MAVLLPLAIVSLGHAANFYGRHGNDFAYLRHVSGDEYDTETHMPVVWDMGVAFFTLRDYYESYGWDGESAAYAAVDSLLEEARSHGVNFVNFRSEIRRMSDGELSDGPEAGEYFVELAEIARQDSLHVVAGGFETSLLQDPSGAPAHNDLVVDYLSGYANEYGPIGKGLGEFLGVFGFDEPDAKFEGPGWNDCDYNWPWWRLVRDYGQECREDISNDILPFGTFLDRWKTANDSLYYRNTIPLFCGELEYPIFDRYPCKYTQVSSRDFEDDIAFDGIIGATDLLPAASVDYGAYASSDEIFAVDEDGYFRVYSFSNVTSHTQDLGVEQEYVHRLRPQLRENPVWAASDFRATDVGERSTGARLLNGAVVFCDPYDPSVSTVFFHDGSSLTRRDDDLEMPAAVLETTAAAVGEYDYPVHVQDKASRRGTLIGRGELRILVCFRRLEGDPPGSVNRARVYAWNGRSFEDVTQGSEMSGLELDITPAGAVWGVFWPTYNYWNDSESEDHSGFIVHDGSGSYQAVFETESQGSVRWEVSPVHTNLFGHDGTTFVTRGPDWYPNFVAGIDYICHLSGGQSIREASLEFAAAPGGAPGSALSVYGSDPFALPDGYTFGDINDASAWWPLKSVYGQKLLVSFDDGEGGSDIFGSTDRLMLRDGDDVSIALESSFLDTAGTDDAPLLALPRVYPVRLPYRVPLVANPDTLLPFQLALIDGDIDVAGSNDVFEEQSQALDTMFVYGIDSTDRANCLMPNVRCAGRRQDGQLTFYGSEDSLLYLMTTAIVHGCRGIHLRAMDFTMMCGNGGEPVPTGKYRCPPLLLNWGPSVETENVDMLSRVHGVVRMLTGKNTDGPDFLSALISEDWQVLDTDRAENAIYADTGWVTDSGNDSLNFIALQETASEDILLLAVNDSGEDLPGYSDYYYIHFPEETGLRYEVHWIAGHEPLESRVDPDLAVSFHGMPGYTASLVLLEKEQ